MNEFVKFLAKMILMHVHLMIGYKKEEQSDQFEGDYMRIMIANRKIKTIRLASNISI